MKKLNIAILIVLLVFQTILSPISVFADGVVSGEDASLPNSEEGQTGASLDGSDNEVTSGDSAKINTLSSPDSAGVTIEDVTMTFAGLRLFDKNNDLIQNATDLEKYTGLNPKKGDTVYLRYDFVVDPKTDYGIGSTFTFHLPKNMIEEYTPGSFNQSKTLEDTGGWAAYSSTYNSGDKTITFTLNSELEEGSVSDGLYFEFMAKFDNFADESKLDQELDIPILGKDNVKLPFTFDPLGSGELLSKQAGDISRAADGTVTIPWTLWVNTGGKELTGATLEDVTDSNHALDGDITVERYSVGLNGFDKNNPGTIVTPNPTAFPINLDNGHFAYKVTYNTKVTKAPTDTVMTYTNTATIKGTDITEISKLGSQTVKYGPSLLKTQSGDKYSSKWTIKYNWLGQKIDADKATLTDNMTSSGLGNHIISYDSSKFKVYQVTLSADGQTAKDKTPLTEGTHYELTNKSAQGFTIDFAKSKNAEDKVTAAFLIEYDTELADEFVTDAKNGTIINTVIREDTNESQSDDVNLNPNIFTKSGGGAGTIDYDNKTITWTLTINAEKALKKFAIVDTFTTTNKAGKTLKHTLTPWSKSETDYFKVTGADGLSYSITDSDGNVPATGNGGFKLDFTSDIPEKRTITIQYKTKFDIEPNGGVATAYKNSATASWDGDSSSGNKSNKESSYTPDGDSPTTKNGYKKVSVNNNSQEFSWSIGMNINKKDIEGATLTDTLGEGQHIIPDGETLQEQITVSRLNLTTEEGEKFDPNQELDANNWSVTPATDINGRVVGFEITFTGLDNNENNEAYLIEYKTKDSDDIYGQSSGEKREYKNDATLATPHDGSYDYSATATISDLANELISKKAAVNTDADTIKWNVTVNASNSKLGKITLTDKPSSNQKLLTGTFTKQEIKLDAGGASENVGNLVNIPASDIKLTGTDANGDPVTVSSTDPVPEGVTLDGGFSLDLGELNEKGYIIEYHTFFLGDPNAGEQVSNEASIGYAGAADAGTSADGNDSALFKYSSSDTSASGKKGTLQLKKFKMNPLTGDRDVFAGVKFELWNRNNTIQLDEGVTEADGTITFNEVRYGKYTLREETPTGYVTIIPFEIMMKKDFDLNDDGKAYIIENIEDVNLTNACPDFKLTIKDINGQPVNNKEITLKDSNGNVKFEHETDREGKVTIPRDGAKALQAGLYQVYEGKEPLGEVTVKYGAGECQDEIQPIKNSCLVFTVTLKDKDGNPRPNVEVVLKDKSGKVITAPDTTTDADGKFTIPSTTPGTAPGEKYELYEDNQYLGEVEVDYLNDNCKTEITQVAKCPIFTLTLKDVDGKGRNNVTVIIKVKATDKNITQSIDPTDSEGKIRISNLEPGVYEVYEGADRVDEFTVKTDCQATIKPAPACPVFTITVKDEDGILPEGTKVTLTNKTTKETIETTVKAEGKVTVPSTTPAGDYEVKITDSKKEIGDVTITYKNIPCEATVEKGRTCDIFTITIKGQDGNINPNVKVIVEDSTGTKVPLAKDTTDAEGKIQLPQNQAPGEYKVYEQNVDGTKGVEIGEVKVTYTGECKDEVKPQPPVTPPGPGGGGSTPPPTETPDPDQPGKPGEETPDPDQPGKPGEETPDPEQPGKPGEETPDPDQPSKPGEETPDPDQPGKPGEETTKPEKPTSPELDKVIDKIPSLPGVTPVPGETPDTPRYEVPNIPQIVEGLKQDPTKLIQTNQELKEFINMYNNLSPEEQAEIDKLIDMNALKNLQAQLEKEAAKFLAANNNQEKLPQTDNANQTGMMLGGLLLVGMSLVLLRRKWASSTK